ncbi:hypothetical protein IWT140_00472 [Secundilactobacillus pentosiphilus]|uniref:Uncharacterized protein n=1 Tax=Secundilactobacillus pentosiphilus TaxID=1714682 RepID=A0A1Z5IM82_9LACO|nr:hypothetical protein IWT140_00472 [Secundilactobacillus pentosiphilus]
MGITFQSEIPLPSVNLMDLSMIRRPQKVTWHKGISVAMGGHLNERASWAIY